MLETLENQFHELLDPNDPLLMWRKKSWNRFLEIGWPKAKQEPFPFQRLSMANAREGTAEVEKSGESRIVFIDGFFSKIHSSVPAPIVCLPLDEAMRTYGVFLQSRLAKTLKEESDPLAVLNGAFQGRGAFLYVPPKLQAEVQIVHYFTASEMAAPRLMIYLGKEARLKLDQEIRSAAACNAYVDALVDEGGELNFRDEAAHESGQSYRSIRASLKRSSRFNARLDSGSADLARTSVKVQLLEEGSEAVLQGLCQLDAERQNHLRVSVEHLAPHTRSRQHFKGILKGKSRSSFEGKIYVHEIAQKTEAYQLNQHLLLSDECVGIAKPNLEIFADDVKASHGATIAQLNEEDLFYLRSRGLSLAEAKRLLIEAFCHFPEA